MGHNAPGSGSGGFLADQVDPGGIFDGDKRNSGKDFWQRLGNAPSVTGTRFSNDIFGGIGGIPASVGATGTTKNYIPKKGDVSPPDPIAASESSLFGQLKDLGQMRRRRTLFTGGQGALDQPSTASSVLLGS